jgi:hypothetical protein
MCPIPPDGHGRERPLANLFQDLFLSLSHQFPLNALEKLLKPYLPPIGTDDAQLAAAQLEKVRCEAAVISGCRER